MPALPTPRQILETLLPVLKTAGAYAHHIQERIARHPDKYNSDNLFANALTDADLSVQTFIEVTLLAHFPELRFHGEEYEKAYNTKYFRAIDLGPTGDYLVTLDPIDGTRFYMDGHPNYQVILTVLNADGFEAVVAISPALDRFYYTLRGQGTFAGTLTDTLETCQPLQIVTPKNNVMLGWRMGPLAEHLPTPYQAIDVHRDYSQMTPIPSVNGLLTGDVAGVVLSRAKFIDGAALAFMAQEMGYILTDHTGQTLPPPAACENMNWPGIVVAANETLHQQLLTALTKIDPPEL
ncbi:MAG: inositol monophosphatase family protein [Cyanobacteria bacterium P01_A01_bin.105]